MDFTLPFGWRYCLILVAVVLVFIRIGRGK